MSAFAIKVHSLGKKYHICGTREQYRTLRDTLVDTFSSPFRRVGQFVRGQSARLGQSEDTIWALEDASFEIKQGEVVGIIGRNGSGKSTLLKILSRITEPTKGHIEILGRVGSLLEVGTGFHSELSGRDNIYLNGAILGMRKAEIDRKFDEIVAFAGVEKFIETPVKHYSSGMYLRLAFAVAAYLEQEILLVDEVLAVGDASFQKKCLDKMEDVGQQGRTVLFVSHNMPAVTRLCNRVILLDEGRVVQDGPSHQVASAYLNSGVATSAVREWPDIAKAPGSHIVRLRAVRARTQDGVISSTVDIRMPVRIEMEYEVLEDGHLLIPHFSVHNEDGLQLFSAVDTDPVWRGRQRSRGRYVSTTWIPGNFLSEGTIIVGAAANTLNPSIMHFYARDSVAFSVVDSFEGDAARGDFPGDLHGVVRPLLKWNTDYNPGVLQMSMNSSSRDERV